MLARADAALYRAKADGRNCIRVVLANPDEGSTFAPPPPLRSGIGATRSSQTAGEYRGPGRRATDFVAEPGGPSLQMFQVLTRRGVRAIPCLSRPLFHVQPPPVQRFGAGEAAPLARAHPADRSPAHSRRHRDRGAPRSESCRPLPLKKQTTTALSALETTRV